MFWLQLSRDSVDEIQWPTGAMQSADDLPGRRRRHCCNVRKIRDTARLVDIARPMSQSGLLEYPHFLEGGVYGALMTP